MPSPWPHPSKRAGETENPFKCSPTDMDAWSQVHELIGWCIQEQDIRPDIEVRALAHKRAVELSLGELRDPDDRYFDRHKWTRTTRNVSTMRELAQALIDACDFVDAMNPKWASGHGPDGVIRIIDSEDGE